jgi:hypothetical protein
MDLFGDWGLTVVMKSRLFWGLFGYWGAMLVFSLIDDAAEKKVVAASALVSMVIAFQIMY